MKKTKKLLLTLLLGGTLSIVFSPTVEANACCTNGLYPVILDFGLDPYPNQIFSTRMVNTHSGHVYNIQWLLNRLGYNPGKVDGYYGNNTANAVRQFQKDHGLANDGIVGRDTWNELRRHTFYDRPNIQIQPK